MNNNKTEIYAFIINRWLNFLCQYKNSETVQEKKNIYKIICNHTCKIFKSIYTYKLYN